MISTLHPEPTVGLSPALQKTPVLPGHISPSAAKNYLGCSLRFYFERVQCIRKATTPALHLGKSVHAAFQAFHIARWRGGDDSPEATAMAFDDAFARLERDEGPVRFADQTEREKCRLDGLRVIAAYLDSPEALQGRPRAVEVRLHETLPGLSVPMVGAVDLIEDNLTAVDFKSAAAKPNADTAAFDHEIQLVGYQMMIEAATGETPPSLDLIYLVKTRTPQVIRIKSPPAGAHRKRRVTAMLETAVTGIAEMRYHPQPGMHCSWCQFRNECMTWPSAAHAPNNERRRAA